MGKYLVPRYSLCWSYHPYFFQISNGPTHSKTANGKQFYNNASERRYSTSPTPQLIVRLSSLSISPNAIGRNKLPNHETRSKPIHTAVSQLTHIRSGSLQGSREKQSATRPPEICKTESSCPLSVTADSLKIKKPHVPLCYQAKSLSSGALKPVPRNALTVLRAYLYSDSDSESTGSSHSFLNSHVSPENCSAAFNGRPLRAD